MPNVRQQNQVNSSKQQNPSHERDAISGAFAGKENRTVHESAQKSRNNAGARGKTPVK